MALGKRYSKSVVFISGCLERDAKAEPKLRGTGFLVGFRFEVDRNQGMVYVITAAHVVRPLSSSFVRLNATEGSVTDHQVKEWIFHPTEDIPVTTMPQPYEDHDFLVVEESDFVGTAPGLAWSPEAGADVYFAGLLGPVPSMGEKNVPMVRTGSIGALYQEGIPMRMPGDTLIRVGGHLIDCRSFGGFSGSPCFVRYLSGTGETDLGLPYPIQSTLLLGMVGGYFDLKATVTIPDQEDKLDIPVAAGVAVVYPAETIREVLDSEPFVAERIEMEALVAGGAEAKEKQEVSD